jgi:hypothetical protein
MFAEGDTAKEVIFAIFAEIDATEAQAQGFLAGLGVGQFCPEYLPEFQRTALELYETAN